MNKLFNISIRTIRKSGLNGHKLIVPSFVLIFLSIFNTVSFAQSCSIDSIRTANMTGCQNNGTIPQWDDDFFEIDSVTVYFKNPPVNGRLELDGFLMYTADTVVITNPADTSYTFQNVVMRADLDLMPPGDSRGQSYPIDLTATFIGTSCDYNNPDSGPEELNYLGKQYNPRKFRNAPRPCSVTVGPEGTVGQFNSPGCWPSLSPATICDDAASYAPPSEMEDQIPLRYVRIVVHVFQRESPLSPENFIASDASLISAMFNDPTYGLNAFYSNLCDSPNDDISPPVTDARIRFVNNGEIGVDLFFHQDNGAWGTGYSGCSSALESGDYTDRGVPLSTLTTNYIDPLTTNSDSWNAFHVFLTGGKWFDHDSLGEVGTPDAADCFYLCQGGFTNGLTNCTSPPRAVISGAYTSHQILQTPNGYGCGIDTSMNSIQIGGSFVGELFHILGLDHISPLQAHAIGGDFCDDTPLERPLQ